MAVSWMLLSGSSRAIKSLKKISRGQREQILRLQTRDMLLITFRVINLMRRIS